VTTQPNSPLDKRRLTVRRAVLAGLVAVCLIVFSLYFRESGSGPLHSAQDAAGAVVAPAQAVASRAVEPFQDAWSWVTGLVDARQDNSRLAAENVGLRTQIINQVQLAEENARLKAMLGIQDDVPSGYRPVNASVIGRSPSSWYALARLDVGLDDGVVVNSPVVAGSDRGAALVGVVTAATGSTSRVAFITDSGTRVGAVVQGSGNAPGVLRATTSGQLLLENVPREFRIPPDGVVVTAGFSGVREPSVYPSGIPIGQVRGVGSREVDVYQTIQVTPFVDVRTVSGVVVLAPVSAAARRRASG
jgi:rod shape-determining protein MreC